MEIVKTVKETGKKYMMMETVVYAREYLFMKQQLDEGDTYTALELAKKAFALRPSNPAILRTLAQAERVTKLLAAHGKLLAVRGGRPLKLVAVSARRKARKRDIDLTGVRWVRGQGYDTAGLSVRWTPPSRMLVDPARETQPIIDQIRSGLISPQEAIRERGYDPDQVLAEWQEFAKKIDELGLILDIDPRVEARRKAVAGNLQEASTP